MPRYFHVLAARVEPRCAEARPASAVRAVECSWPGGECPAVPHGTPLSSPACSPLCSALPWESPPDRHDSWSCTAGLWPAPGTAESQPELALPAAAGSEMVPAAQPLWHQLIPPRRKQEPRLPGLQGLRPAQPADGCGRWQRHGRGLEPGPNTEPAAASAAQSRAPLQGPGRNAPRGICVGAAPATSMM